MSTNYPLGCTDRQASGYHTHQQVDEELSDNAQDARDISDTVDWVSGWVIWQTLDSNTRREFFQNLRIIRNHAKEILERETK